MSKNIKLKNVAGLFNLLISGEPANNKKYPMIITVSDTSKKKIYVKKLMSLLKKYPKLRQQSLLFSPKRLHRVGLGDLIIFGDAPRFEQFDYRIEENADSIYESDYQNADKSKKYRYKEYDLIEDFVKIKKRLRKYAIANGLFSGLKPKKKYKSIRGYDELVIEVVDSSRNRKVPTTRTTRKLNCGYQPVSVNKVKVHDNFVKIGFDLYEIDVDFFTGEESIKLDNGERLVVEEDCYGNKYLVQ